MNDDRLQYGEIVDLLTDGPTGERRYWAAMVVLRMLETKVGCRYRGDNRLCGAAKVEAAIGSLRAAIAALSQAERGLLLRTILLMPWEHVRRDAGLSLRLPDLLAALGKDVGAFACLAAAQSVIEQGDDAVRRYPLDGLLPEVRQPGQGLIVTFDTQDCRLIEVSETQIEIDRLTLAVQSFRGLGWEANLRPLVAWDLSTLPGRERDRVVATLLSDLPAASKDEQVRWRSLGLLDWMAAHRDHPRAGEAMAVGRQVSRADVRKAAADVAAALGRWDVLEALERDDPDRGVRQRARKLLTSMSGRRGSGGQGDLFERPEEPLSPDALKS
jgi:hypothetical protein